jgi:hypothetical protein
MTAPLTPAERDRLRSCQPPAGLSPTQWAALVQGRAPVPAWLRPRLAPLLADPVPTPPLPAVAPEPAPATAPAPQPPASGEPAPAESVHALTQGPAEAAPPAGAQVAPRARKRKRRNWDPDTLAVAAILHETRHKPKALIRHFLKAQGRPWVDTLVAQALEAHAAGTERRQDGTPRTLGGCFFALAKRAQAGPAPGPAAPRP